MVPILRSKKCFILISPLMYERRHMCHLSRRTQVPASDLIFGSTVRTIATSLTSTQMDHDDEWAVIFGKIQVEWVRRFGAQRLDHLPCQEHVRTSEDDIQLSYSKWFFIMKTIQFAVFDWRQSAKRAVCIEKCALMEAGVRAYLSETSKLDHVGNKAHEHANLIHSRISRLRHYREIRPDMSNIQKFIARANDNPPQLHGALNRSKRNFVRQAQFDGLYVSLREIKQSRSSLEVTNFDVKTCVLELLQSDLHNYLTLVNSTNSLLNDEVSRHGALKLL